MKQQLDNWADRLLIEYEEGRKELREMKNNLNPEILTDQQDEKLINSMIDSMTYSIDWMKTGRQPDVYRGIDRKNKYRVKLYDDMDVIPDISEQLEREPLYLTQEQRRALLMVIKNLSHRERQCYIMYEAENLSMQKIANRLGIKKRTVQQYIERAREKVEKIVS